MATPKDSVLGTGTWLELVRRGRWELVRRPHISNVVGVFAFTAKQEVVLVEQPRVPLNGQSVLEIPAGLVGDEPGLKDEPLAAAARRELLEETGYAADTLIELTEIPSCPGLTSETMHLFLANDVTKVGPGGGVGDEEITVHLIPLTELANALHRRMALGQFIDPKVFAVPFFAEG